ncbi:SMI1/KNR4 family protein [Delftia sp. PS-11]|uniref:SMI1/KNR4 family protein n=1 Tax=Delftia sp. PS-11 TaxID=2767222 RepID=UPI0024570A3D|nr:SMI1/KNR4 family protein [Delftia sp. PS-11]KAJ8743942.1 SMI1/KNR4 family protein [Delftia sp. PS-11]
MNHNIINLKNNYPFMFSEGAGENKIQELIEIYHDLLSSQYQEFLRFSGGAVIGAYPVYGVSSVDLMDAHFNTANKVTKKYEEDGMIEKGRFLVISENHAGDPIYLNLDGSVVESSHDGFQYKSWENFNEFIKCCAGKS